MLVVGQILLLVMFCLVLVKSTEVIVGAVKKIARRLGVGSFGITAFVLALATSLPELVVGITASIEKIPSVVMGNVLGSNIADISLVIGGAAIAAGGLRITGETLKRDIYLVFGAAILPVLLIADHVLSRADGVVLLMVYVMFISTVLRKHTRAMGEHALDESPIRRLLIAVTKKGGRTDALRLGIGIFALLLSSHMIVQLAKGIAVGLNVPVLLIGLFLVAVGTSLPELVFEMKAVREGQVQMALGDLLGSVVANATLILGVSSIIYPIRLDKGLDEYLVAIGALVVLYVLFIVFSRSKSRLSRWEGLVLLLIYFAFVVLEMGRV